MTAYYNEYDPFAAQWLMALIADGQIAPGVVDTRDIRDVTPNDLKGFTQCHFFAGIGVFSYALRCAGFSDDREIWTGSAPCQPFSAAGKGGGFDDERHLWPAWQWLIGQYRPKLIVGEQVAAKSADAWIDLVHADLEGMGYAFGCVALPAASVGAPHIRDRTFWVADSGSDGIRRRYEHGTYVSASSGIRGETREQRVRADDGTDGATDRLDDDDDAGLEGLAGHGDDRNEPRRIDAQSGGHAAATGCTVGLVDAENRGRLGDPRTVFGAPGRSGSPARVEGPTGGSDRRAGATVGLANNGSERRDGRQGVPAGRDDDREDARRIEGNDGPVGLCEARNDDGPAGPVNGWWRDVDWLFCRDGKWRPVRPGSQPLVNGASARVGRLRGYGNAIVAPLAQAFIETVMSIVDQ